MSSASTMNSATTMSLQVPVTLTNDHFLCPITQEVMKDPVIGSDGITYERSAIEAWFAAGHRTSPLTRQPMTSQSLVPNIALRSMIEEAQRASPPALCGAGAAAAAAPAPVATPPTLSVARTPIGDVVFKVTETDTAAALPTIFIDVLDISGSMGNPAAEPSRNAEAAAFSRADLVRHSVATQIELLRPTDQLGIVLFDHGITEALPPMAMTASGRTAAKSVLPLIRPSGGTNIWSGIQRGLAMAERALSAAGSTPHNVVLIVQTDGESDPSYNPPRGIVGTFRAWLDAHPGVRLTVHTVGYGFGKALDMPLLREIADAGGGTVNYIADGSMVGTVFIHLLANLMSCAHTGLVFQIPDIGFVERLGFLQVGQTRHIHVPAAGAATAGVTASLTAYLKNSAGDVIAEVSVPSADPTGVVTDADFTETAFGICRQSFSNVVSGMLHACEAHTGGAAWPGLAEFDALHAELAASQHRDARITALLSDLDDTDPAKGQISKAFASADAFGRWGRHYIPWVLSGHRYEWAINFRDESSLHAYGTPATRALVARGDEIFLTLPQPTASCQAQAAAYGGYGAPPAAPSLTAVHSSVGPCFLPASTVLMADGSKKRCDQIQPGELVAPHYRIRCVIKTEVPYADIVQLGDRVGSPEEVGGFTMWHPVFVDGEWKHPADIGQVQRVVTDAIYNFVLDEDHVILLNGVMTCTMGHDMTANAVIDHPYFGKRRPGVRNIIDDLSASPGWDAGYVVWRNVSMEKDPVTGLITRLIPGA